MPDYSDQFKLIWISNSDPIYVFLCDLSINYNVDMDDKAIVLISAYIYSISATKSKSQ